STRIAASETAISAGCALAVNVSSSSGPSHIKADRFCSSASSTSANTARASGKASARSLPIPTAWLPWPGKVKAIVMTALLQPVVERACGSTRPRGQGRINFDGLSNGVEAAAAPHTFITRPQTGKPDIKLTEAELNLRLAQKPV